MKQRLLKVLFVICVFVAGSLFGKYIEGLSEGVAITEVRQGGYSLINPLLECETQESLPNSTIVVMKNEVEKVVEKHERDSGVDDISVYFRDLNNGPRFGIDENREFSPASLLKVPVMMAYFKEAEERPETLEEKAAVAITDDKNEKRNFPSKRSLKNGEYTISELISYMIVDSDNNAAQELLAHIDEKAINKTYYNLGVVLPGIRDAQDSISVSEYASFFRILYNASYLNKEYSSKALELLAKVDFRTGIRAGVPRGVLVANKYGERGAAGKKQLHDCGIIYYPDHPYLLCIMTRGDDFDQMTHAIREISAIIYAEVDERRGDFVD